MPNASSAFCYPPPPPPPPPHSLLSWFSNPGTNTAWLAIIFCFFCRISKIIHKNFFPVISGLPGTKDIGSRERSYICYESVEKGKVPFLVTLYREYLMSVFDIKFTRQGFDNASWHHEACKAIQHAFSKPSLVNLISKDANLVFFLSVFPLFHSSN